MFSKHTGLIFVATMCIDDAAVLLQEEILTKHYSLPTTVSN